MTTERHQENSEILARCIKENLGFKDGKHVAASVIYKCLLHWHAFKSERTAIFDFIFENINSVLKAPKNQRVHGAKSSRSLGGIPQKATGSQWEKIIEFLDSLMDRLRGNHSIIAERMLHIFKWEYVKSGLAELEKWIANAKEEVIHQKRKKSHEEIQQDLCRIDMVNHDSGHIGDHNIKRSVATFM